MVLTQYVTVDNKWKSKKESSRHRHKRVKLDRLANMLANRSIKDSQWLVKNRFVKGSSSGNQLMYCLPPLGSFAGTKNTYDDLTRIASDMPQPLATGQNWPSGVSTSKEIRFKYAQQKVEFKNTSVDSNIAYLDIYKYICRDGEVDYADPDTMFSVAPAKWSLSTAVTSTSIGITPFDFKEIVGKVKILGKSSMVINHLQATEFTWGRGPFTLGGMDIAGLGANTDFSLPNVTMGLIIVQTGPVGAGTDAMATSLDLFVQNTYSCRPVFNTLGGLIQTTGIPEADP